MNDLRETELSLSYMDPPASKKIPYAKSISWAFEDNTRCQTVILNGVRTRENWYTRGFNDAEAEQILDVLSTKRLREFTFTSYPLLTNKTYQKIADMITRSNNHWSHITLGKISDNKKIADIFQKSGKVSFTRIIKPVRSNNHSFLSFLLNREKIHERS